MKTIIQKSIFVIFILAAALANAQQWGYYTLYAPSNSTTAYLIDTADSPVTFKTWTFSSSKKTGYSTYLVPGDTLVRSYGYTASGGLSGGGMTGAVQKVLWDNTVVWDYQYNSSTYSLHHDICPMKNGNVLMIAYEVKSATLATQAGASSATSVWSEKIMEVKPTGATTGTVVWEWKLWDHLCQNYNAAKDNYVTSIVNNPQLMNINIGTSQDRFHMNGIDYNEALDQIVVSMHMTNEIYVIDHSTTTAVAATHTGGNAGKGGDFLYRWGKPANYGATGTAIFNVVHDAHWVPSDNPNYPGYLCAFNNKGGTGSKSAFTIVNPPLSGYTYNLTLGQAYTPSTYNYQYTSAYTANDMGNSQQLPNGNVLMCVPGMGSGAIFEVNAAGTTLWSKTATSPHAYRFTLCAVRGPVASSSATSTVVCSGAQISLNSSALSVTETNPSYSYSWNSSPAGFTSSLQNPTLTAGAAGTYRYNVTITNSALGCYDTASVLVTVNACTDVELQNNKPQIEIFPNPTTGIVTINNGETNISDMQIVVSDVTGREIMKMRNTRTIDLSAFPDGIYFIAVLSGENSPITRKIVLSR
ncbi:MAG: aryl-sulfate sulfotransferase [Bacteroidota bacterium]